MRFSYVIKETGYTPASSQGKERRSSLILALKITEKLAYSAYLSQPGTYSLSASNQHYLLYPEAVCSRQTNLDYGVSLLSSEAHSDQIHPGVLIRQSSF